MASSVFISYSHTDAELIEPVVGLLRGLVGLVFQDIYGIQPGKKWRDEIERAISMADLVVLFWCVHSASSEEVQAEYQLALNGGRDVLPVLLD
jgi:TIR domain